MLAWLLLITVFTIVILYPSRKIEGKLSKNVHGKLFVANKISYDSFFILWISHSVFSK
jgi:hypothetical protein